MFFSKEQIEQSVKHLHELHSFFGITFLVLKEQNIPVGNTKNLKLTILLESFLQKYYRLIQQYEGFYIPFKMSKHWVSSNYARSLHDTAISSFSDVFIHPKGSNEWGWKAEYIDILASKLYPTDHIPTIDLAVWLFREKDWNNTSPTQVGETFIDQFHISDKERTLFRTNVLQEKVFFHEKRTVSTALLDGIGYPESMATQKGQQKNLPLSNSPNFLFSPLATLAEYGAKLQQLRLTDVGPIEDTEIDFAPRLNVITGDNALGKTFLLDCAWWALTSTWAKYPVSPRLEVPKDKPRIAFQIGKEYRPNTLQSIAYNWRGQFWNEPENRNTLPGLSIYSQADGSFAVWDPAKFDEKLHADGLLKISPTEIWYGVREPREGKIVTRCRGIIDDWKTWQSEPESEPFKAFCAALIELSPHDDDKLVPGKPTRVPDESGDVQSVPTLHFPYGDVPIIHCSAGIKRIVALAYSLVWAWNEHVINSELIGEKPQRSIVLLIDEMEAHLHPAWQRTIVPAVMEVINALSEHVGAQIIIATHSPLILASMEPLFDEEIDNLFHLRLEMKDGSIHLDDIPFVKRGRVDLWLMSELFGLRQPRSKAAEEAIEAAKRLQLQKDPKPDEVEQVSEVLTKVLAPDDQFWARWRYFATETVKGSLH